MSKNLIEEVKWFPSVLKVDKSYTYDEFQQSDSPYKEPLKQIASVLANRNIDDSHEWVEQMMIFYNKESGKLLKNSHIGILRRHSAPNTERLERFRQMGITELEKLAYSSAEYCLSTESNTVHYGLETDAYAHASSPIRRYADLVNQRLLKKIIANTMSDSNEILINKMNQRGKAIKRFSRDMIFLEAISTRNTRFKAIIVEHKMMDNNKKKVKLYVPEWGRMVSAWFTLSSSENVVLSRDETREIDVTLGREVEFDCVFIPNARNWKERVVIQIL